jgi:hypothetical protein
MKRPSLADVACLSALCGTALFVALMPIWEMDVYFHVAVGRYILAHHALPRTDVWSAADATRAYVPPHWLFDAAVAALDRWRGLEAVRLAAAALVTVTFGAFYVLLRRLGHAPLAALAIGAALLVSFHARIRPRPHLINLAVEIALLAWVLRVRAARPWHAVPALVLFFVWACVHNGGAFLGAAMLAALAFASLLLDRGAESRVTQRTLLLVALAATVGWALNPAAFSSFAAFNVEELAGIGEWQRWPALGDEMLRGPYFWVTRAFPPLALIALVLALRAWWRERRAQPFPYELVLAAMWVALSFSAMRFFYLAVLALVLIAWPRKSLRAPVAAAIAALALGTSLHYEARFYPSLREAWRSRALTVETAQLPVTLTDLLVDAGVEARVAVPPHWGSYLLYRAPALTVTVDGRNAAPETVMVTTHEILRLRESAAGRDALPRLYSSLPADFLLMPRPAFGAGDTGEWLRVASAGPAELWARRSQAAARWLPRLAEVAARRPSRNTAGAE